MGGDGANDNEGGSSSNLQEEQGNNHNETLCCVQLSVQQGRTWHWFMFFQKNDVTKSGIWFHGITTAIERAKSIPTVDYCNAQVHQAQSKRNAGYDVANPTQQELMVDLYPWKLTVSPPTECVEVEIWPTTVPHPGSN